MVSSLEKMILDSNSFTHPLLGSINITFFVIIFLAYFRREELNSPPLEKPFAMVQTTILELRSIILLDKVAILSE